MTENEKPRQTSTPPSPGPDALRDQADRMQARAHRFFDSQEDTPFSAHATLLTICAFVGIFILWASFASLDEVTRGNGRIIPSSEVQIIQNLEGGIVEEFFAREGQEVKKGQILLRLRDLDASSDLEANRTRYLGLKAAVERLQAEAEGLDVPAFGEDVVKGAPKSVTEQTNAFRANQENVRQQIRIFEQQISQREQEVSELETRARDLRKVIKLSVEEKSMIEPLVERGSAPKVEMIQLERGIQERRTELNGVLEALPRAKAAVDEILARIEEIHGAARAKAQNELSTTLLEMNTIQETLSALTDRKTRTEIRSPVDGVVQDFKVNTVGGVVKPGEDVVEIVPLGDQLLVEAKIRPSDIAFLYPRQPAMVKITAYDFSIYGGLKGEVVDISADAFTDERGESFYRVRLKTHENSLRRRGEVLPILPGMVASVDILTGKKTVMEYLVKPFIKTLGNAMNER